MQVVEDILMGLGAVFLLLIAAIFAFIALLILADQREARRAVKPTPPLLREAERIAEAAWQSQKNL